MAELTAVADVAEAVGEEAFELADGARSLDPRVLKYVALGLGVGLVGGYFIGGWHTNKRLRLKYEQIAEEEIAEMRDHFQKRLIAREEKPDLSSEAERIVKREGYDGPTTPVLEEDKDEGTPPEEEEVFQDPTVSGSDGPAEEAGSEEEAEVESVFDKDEPQEGQGWDYEAEVGRRRPEYPYVIHVDERYERDGYTHTELTYYAGDDVLCDADDKPVEEIDKVVGVANLEKFGHGSGDKSVVFIRNDELKLEVEVTRDEGSFSEVVHGIKHSADPPRRRRERFDDETSP